MTKKDNPSWKENRDVQHFRWWSTRASFSAWAIVLTRPRQSCILSRKLRCPMLFPEAMRTFAAFVRELLISSDGLHRTLVTLGRYYFVRRKKIIDQNYARRRVSVNVISRRVDLRHFHRTYIFLRRMRRTKSRLSGKCGIILEYFH